MALFFIAYDIDESNEEEYEDLWKELEDSGAKRVQKSVRVLRSQESANSLRKAIGETIGEEDRLLVIEKKDWSAWNPMCDINSI
jgi:CRISPR-associated endonuclease Cas2